jgi:Arc/MetJ-type ribon-helix-helix transcriptional regulator
MKQKISISVEEETVEQIEKRIKDGTFRNKSHCVEYAVKKLLEK